MADKSEPAAPAKKPNVFVRIWKWLDLQPFFVILGMKGALPATIGLAAYQGTAFAETYTTLGYLVSIIATLALCFQPRAKFIQSLLIGVFAVCLGAAATLLQIRCVVSSRSAPSGGTKTGGSGSSEANLYDSSANATSATFLVFWVYLANVVKSARPQLMLPMIQFSIFTIVASTYAPNFPTMVAGMSFVRRLLIAMLSGHALAAGVSLFIIPTTSRSVLEKQMTGFTKLLKACLAAHGGYMRSIHNTVDVKGEASPEEIKAAAQLKGLLAKTNELLGKMKLEMNFARMEGAYGKLGPDHYTRLFAELRSVYQPVVGMTTFLGIIKNLREHNAVQSVDPDVLETMKAVKKLEADEWEEVISISREPFMVYQQVLFESLQHIVYQLGFEKRPKARANPDVEKTADSSHEPGDPEFSKHLEHAMYTFQQHRLGCIQEWAKSKNLTLPKHFWRNTTDKPQLHRLGTTLIREKVNQHQLYMILYMNFLHMAVGRALLRLTRYADSLVEDGTMKQRRIIFPGWRRLKELFTGAIFQSDSDITSGVNNGSSVYLGDGFSNKKDPEHLPPTNIYERITDTLRWLPHALRTRHSLFGIRAALATISIGIIGFLSETRPFFLQQRGMWALIMVAISMDPFAGQGVFGFAARIFGTTVAMVVSIVLFYMCDHKAAAIITIFWLYMSCWNIFMIKHIEYAMISMISSITVVLIVGYELQVHKIGLARATSNGQEYYPIALLAVYRLASVCAGLFSAFFWTYFPFPITTHGALRKDVGSALYILANYYSCVHTTLDARLHLGPSIVDLPKNHPVRQLDAIRIKVFGKVLLMLNRVHTHAKFIRFEPPFGGRFPKQAYADLVSSIENIFAYMALIEYCSNAYIKTSDDLRLSRTATLMSEGTTSTLATPTVSNNQPIRDPEKEINSEDETPNSETDLTTSQPNQDTQTSLSLPNGVTTLQPHHNSSTVLPGPLDAAAEEAWLTSFRHFAASTYQRVTSHSLTSTMCLLSAAIKNDQPLPPYLRAPPALAAPSGGSMPKHDRKEVEREEENLLDIEHIAHPAFAAFAVGEVASAFVTAELGKVLGGVRGLVGEVDFSFHVVGAQDEEAEGDGEGQAVKWWEMVEREKEKEKRA